MWLFLPYGFFSIVAHEKNQTTLIVRARAKDDLQAFVGQIARRGGVYPIHTTPHNDYPFRIFVERDELATFMAATVYKLDYPNFKARAMGIPGASAARNTMLHDVWSLLRRAFWTERPPARQELVRARAQRERWSTKK